MNNVGISLYLSSGIKKNENIVKKAHKAKVKYAFTSLHIPEENIDNYADEVKELLNLCAEYDLKVIADIGPRTIEKLGFKSVYELKEKSITHLRVDYGFSLEEIADLSEEFNIVFNASTLLKDDIKALKNITGDLYRFGGCHNFYPKPLTALSLETVEKINRNLAYNGITTMAFVAGDKEARGPLHEGLPTVESHRCGDVLLNILQLMKDGDTDIVLIGDVDVSDDTWKKIGQLNEGYVALKSTIDDKYSYVKGIIHHDRPDSSEYVIRSQESRTFSCPGEIIDVENSKPRKAGSISIGNKLYKRYSGELEVARINLNEEKRVNIIGSVDDDYIKYLKYIKDGMGFRLED